MELTRISGCIFYEPNAAKSQWYFLELDRVILTFIWK